MLTIIKFGAWLASLIRLPLQFLVKMTILPNEPMKDLQLDPDKPVIYVIRTRSVIHLNLLIFYCKKMNMPSPFGKDGRSRSFLFLGKTPGWIRRSSQLPFYESMLEDIMAGDYQNVQLLPVSFYWGRNPGRENSLLRLLFSDSESATFLQRITIMILQGRNSFLNFGEPLDLNQAVDENASAEQKTRKVTRILRVYFHRERLAAMGPLLSDRKSLGHSIIAANSVKAAIKREMANKGTSYSETSKVARSYFNEMASDYSYITVRFFSHFLTWLWTKLYDGVEVRHVERLRELANGHELVFVPCHRSHMDYLLISYVLYHNGLMIPQIAAGINLNFWPVGGFLRRAGAFFMRRSFSGNKLYSAVFNEYLYSLFNKGYSVEYFVEGTRSRTGRLLKPKSGMISMTLQSVIRGTKKPVIFIPTYIGYERVIEVKSYFKELGGKQKRKESVGQLLGMSKALKQTYGKVQVCFGEPINPLQLIKENVPEHERRSIEFGERPSWLTPQSNQLATMIVTKINETAALSSIGMVSLVMLELPRFAIEQKELEIQLDIMFELCKKNPYSKNITMEQTTGAETIHYCHHLGLLQEAPHPLGAIAFLPIEVTTYLHYYRNNILHLFILPSLLASCFVNKKERSKKELEEYISAIYAFVKAELFLPWDDDELKQQINRFVEIFVELELLVQNGEILERPRQISLAFSRLQRLASIAMPVLERYAAVLALLTIPSPNLNKTNIEEKSLRLSQRISILHARNNPDLYDKGLYKDFVGQLKSEGLIALSDEQIEITPELVRLKDQTLELVNNELVYSLQLTIQETMQEQEA